MLGAVWFVVLLLLIMGGAGALITGAATKKPNVGLSGAAVLVLSFVLLFFSMFTSVGAHDVGIVTSFGAPVGDIGPGGHLLPPWEDVTLMDHSVQADTFTGPSCVTVRLADQQTACARVTLIWQMRQSASDTLFRQYGSSGAVQTRLVDSELSTALNDVFQYYDPIVSLQSPYKPGSPQNPTVTQLAKKVTAEMQRDMGSQIKVYKVLVPTLSYTPAVESRIATILAQVAATDVAEQAVKTAQAQAQAANLLSRAQLTPSVLAQTCYNITSEAMKVGYTLPPSWNCSGNSTSLGVITNTKG